MMHLASQILLLLVALTGLISLAADHRRAKNLARLTALVDGIHAGEQKEASPAERGMKLPPLLDRYLIQAGITPRLQDVAMAVIVLIAAAGGAFVFAGPFAAAGAAAALILAAYGALGILGARRTTKLANALPGFFDRLRQLLAVGNSLPTAFARTVLGSPPFLAQFFEPTLRRVHNGAGFADTIRQSADAVQLYEMRLFATAVAANSRFGGSLVQALDNLVLFLRKRAAMERELRAATAQIRASAWVLGLLPVLVGGAIMVQNHDYAAWFVTNPSGRKLLAYCLISQIAGALVMRRVVRTSF